MGTIKKGNLMKFISLVAVVSFSLSAFASQLPANSLSPEILVKEVISRGNRMPGPRPARAVQTELTFVVETCRKVTEEDFALSVNRIERGTLGVTTEVSVAFKQPFFDCFGITHETELRLTTNKIAPYGAVKVLNPVIRRTFYVH